MTREKQWSDFRQRLEAVSPNHNLKVSLSSANTPLMLANAFRLGVFNLDSTHLLQKLQDDSEGLVLATRLHLPLGNYLNLAVLFQDDKLASLISRLNVIKQELAASKYGANNVRVYLYDGGIRLFQGKGEPDEVDGDSQNFGTKLNVSAAYYADTANDTLTSAEQEWVTCWTQLLPNNPPQNLSKSGAVASPQLEGVPSRIQSVLERKGQVILYGPPGTGKTYWAQRTARNLAALNAFGEHFESLSEKQQLEIADNQQANGLVRTCCFHPGYGYEDFLEGYRPQTIDGQIAFELRDGIFKQLCRDAAANPQRRFYLVIDEINRGDIPRIFGELLTVLERDKRNSAVVLPVSQQTLRVPENVYLIGTMNTADRSISLLDAALRRRFGFIELMPDGSKLGDRDISGIPLQTWFNELNLRIREYVGRDARNLQIGHSYLMQDGRPISDFQTLKQAIRDDVIPLISEYCYEDFTALQNILGRALVDIDQSRIQEELFDDGQEKNLIQALLEFMPEAPATTTAPESSEPEATGDGDDAANEATES